MQKPFVLTNLSLFIFTISHSIFTGEVEVPFQAQSHTVVPYITGISYLDDASNMNWRSRKIIEVVSLCLKGMMFQPQ